MNLLHENIMARDPAMTAPGLCPLLAVVATWQGGVAMGLVCLSALVVISVIISLMRDLIPAALRLTIIILVSATVLSMVQMLMQLWFYESSLHAGIYVPLVAMNCLVLSQAEEYAVRHSVLRSLAQALVMGGVILLLLAVIGAVREYSDLMVIRQAPGALLLLALVLAGWQWLQAAPDQLKPRLWRMPEGPGS